MYKGIVDRSCYYGKEIITPKSSLLLYTESPGKGHPKNAVKWRQLIEVKCQKCGSIFNKNYGTHRLFMKKHLNLDSNYSWKCHKCKVQENNQKIFKGKSLEERVGSTRAQKIKERQGKKGELNAQFGKPAYQGSGNGWSGWYKGEYFRSLRELSFIVKYLERFKLPYRSMERKEDAIPYFDWKQSLRNYFPDYLVAEKYIVEIKPKSLWYSKEVLKKEQAAVGFCIKNNYIYKKIDPVLLSRKEMFELYEQGYIRWLERYEIKFKHYKEKI